jgi:hypothetical protein
MLGGHINILLELFRNSDYNINDISHYEWMFFVSAVHTKTIFNISLQKCADLIRSYRNLSMSIRKSVVEVLKDKLVPENYEGDKTDKRDFHNWLNKAAQIFCVLVQTVYFDKRDNRLVSRELKYPEPDKVVSVKLKRSCEEKHQYFLNHNIKRTLGFELHHVVPLSWAENIHQFTLLDK